MKKFFETAKEARKAAKERGKQVFDLGKKRKKRRFFVGTEFEWLNL